MELHLPKAIHNFYWIIFPILLVIRSYQNIVINWELPLMGFNELEDFGSLLFVFGISACESALMTVCLWCGIKFLKQVFSKIV